MTRGVSVNPETRQRIAELCAQGMTRNAIAREVQLAGGTVSRIAAEIGHTFDRTETRAAVEARQVDLAAERVKLAEAAALQAWQALDDMNAPTLLVHFEAGTDNRAGGFREHLLDRPQITDQRNLATVFGIMVSKVAELSRPLGGSTSAESLSVLERVGDSIANAARALLDEGVDPTVEPDDDTLEHDRDRTP